MKYLQLFVTARPSRSPIQSSGDHHTYRAFSSLVVVFVVVVFVVFVYYTYVHVRVVFPLDTKSGPTLAGNG